jgi:hypothetical protein
MQRLLSPGLAFGGVIIVGAILVSILTDRPDRTATLLSINGPRLELATLIDGAAVIAVVRPIGAPTAHWNSSSNAAWTAEADAGIVPMIVSDQTVVVDRAWRGAVPGTLLDLRTIGGIVGRHEFRDVHSQQLALRQTYLVFLRQDDWPGHDLVEPGVLSPIGRAQGVFQAAGQGFINAGGIRLTADDLERVIDGP